MKSPQNERNCYVYDAKCGLLTILASPVVRRQANPMTANVEVTAASLPRLRTSTNVTAPVSGERWRTTRGTSLRPIKTPKRQPPKWAQPSTDGISQPPAKLRVVASATSLRFSRAAGPIGLRFLSRWMHIAAIRLKTAPEDPTDGREEVADARRLAMLPPMAPARYIDKKEALP